MAPRARAPRRSARRAGSLGLRRSVVARVVALVALVALVAPRAARAELFDAPVQVIEPGRERDALALLAPATPGAAVTPAARLFDVTLRPTYIELSLRLTDPAASASAPAHLRLAARGAAPPVGYRELPPSRSFALSTDAPEGAPAASAAALLAERVRARDAGGFFRSVGTVSPAQRGARAAGLRPWLRDGFVLLLGFTALTLALLGYEARRGPRWLLPALAALLVASLALRLALPVRAALDVWPYSRLGPLPRLAFAGPWLEYLSARLGRVFTLPDVIFFVGLWSGVLGPVALFAHARPVLGDPRAALAASALLCVLPQHLRFSHSDTGYVPSVWFTALALALAHHGAHAPRRWLRALALVALPPTWLVELDVRPLNVAFGALALLDLWLLGPRETPRARRALASAVVLGTLGYYLLTGYLAHNAAQVREGLAPGTLLRGALSIFSLRHNALAHPLVTPTGFLLVALYGARVLYARRERALLGYLAGWLVAFFVLHGIVQPPELAMQARYHLQLVSPFALLAGVGLVALYDDPAKRRLAKLLGLYALAAPLLHLRFVRDVRFDDVREFAFVSAVAERVPRGCTVLEYDWPDGLDRDLRFARLGLVVDRGTPGLRFSALGLAPPRRDGAPLAAGARSALRDEARARIAQASAPGSCLYYYEGLACFTQGATGPGGVAPACAEARAALAWQPVAREALYGRFYDDHYRVPDGRAVTLTLYRAP